MSFSEDSDDDVPPPPPPPPPMPSAEATPEPDLEATTPEPDLEATPEPDHTPGMSIPHSNTAPAEEELEIQMTPTLERLMKSDGSSFDGEVEEQQGLIHLDKERTMSDPGRKKKCLLFLGFLAVVGAGVGVALGLTLGKNDTAAVDESQAAANDAAVDVPAPAPESSTPVDSAPTPSEVDVETDPTAVDDTSTETSEEITPEAKEEIALRVLESSLPTSSFTALQSTPESPQTQSLNWLLEQDEYVYDWEGLASEPMDETAEMNFMQRYVAATLFIGMGGENWKNGENWMSRLNVCTWVGVGCVTQEDLDGTSGGGNTKNNGDDDNIEARKLQTTAVGTITSLALIDNKLDGFIPEDISALTSLTSIEMHQNRIRGTIPPSIFDISTLETLFLDANQLEGTIPTLIGKLTNLKRLSLNDNGLEKMIPTEVGQLENLAMLWLFNNDGLAGKIPTEIGNLGKLGGLITFCSCLPLVISIITFIWISSCIKTTLK